MGSNKTAITSNPKINLKIYLLNKDALPNLESEECFCSDSFNMLSISFEIFGFIILL